MSIVNPPTPSSIHVPPAVPNDFIWRLTTDQYHEMIRAGILTEDDPIELLEGWLVTKMPKIPRHALATGLVSQALEGKVPSGWYVRVQDPVTLEDSEPEPGVMVVRGHVRQYLDRHPGARDVALIVEVADASLKRDRGSKKRLYARAGVPVYWIVNLIDKQIEVYTEPSGTAADPDYRTHQDYGPADEVPLSIEGREIGRFRRARLASVIPVVLPPLF